MTLDEMKTCDRAFLNAGEVADVLKCDPHYIRVAAHMKPAALGFPVIVVGCRVKIPRVPFVRFITGGTK